MTAPQVHQDVVDAFTGQLPDEIRERLRITTALTYHLGVAVRDRGWTVPQLVHEATRDLATAESVGGIIHDRIKVCTTIGPARTSKTAIPKGIPFCTDECRDRQGWIEDHNGNITGRCPCRTGGAAS